MPPSVVPGFDDHDPKYKCCCCYDRSCAMAIGVLHAVFGSISLMAAIQGAVNNKTIMAFMFGGGAGLFVLIAGLLLIVGVHKEKVQYFLPFLILCVINIILVLAQGIMLGLELGRLFDEHGQEKICKRLQKKEIVEDCDLTTQTNLTIALCVFVLVTVLFEVYFFYKVYRARRYLQEKEEAKKNAPQQMALLETKNNAPNV